MPTPAISSKKNHNEIHQSFPVLEMTCAACAVSVESMLKATKGVRDAGVNYANQSAWVDFDNSVVTPIDLQNAVLLHDAKQHEQAEHRVDVQVGPQHPQRQKGEGQCERQGQQNRQRMDQALELSGQHHVHEQEAQQEREHEIRVRLLQQFGSTQKLEAISRRQVLATQVRRNFLHGVAQRGAVQIRHDHHLPLAAIAIDGGCP